MPITRGASAARIPSARIIRNRVSPLTGMASLSDRREPGSSPTATPIDRWLSPSFWLARRPGAGAKPALAATAAAAHDGSGPAFGPTARQGAKELSQSEALVLMCIAYFQRITRGELSSFFGKEVSRDLIGVLRARDLIASEPPSPQPAAPYTYVTTKTFLSQFGLDTLRQLPDLEALEDAAVKGEAFGRKHHAGVFEECRWGRSHHR